MLKFDYPIESFSRKWRVRELAVFGSALREDFHKDSDMDILVTFEPEASWSLSDTEAMRLELVKMFGREVDLVSRRAIEMSRNQRRKKAILSTAKVIYAA
ncbi:MAG: hypothetical protein FJY65_12860 [Calditrichaeota bacterium]|nr:hypothetical protein [Calditrichota bacterium]